MVFRHVATGREIDVINMATGPVRREEIRVYSKANKHSGLYQELCPLSRRFFARESAHSGSAHQSFD